METHETPLDPPLLNHTQDNNQKGYTTMYSDAQAVAGIFANGVTNAGIDTISLWPAWGIK